MEEAKKFHSLFPGQEPDEIVKGLFRRHWLKVVRHIVWFVIQLLLPIAVGGALIYATEVTIEPDSLAYLLLILGLSVYYLFVLLFFYADLVDYHLDIWVVTHKRVISIEQTGLFHRVVAEQPIINVQDVTHEVKGRLATLLDFGEVHIQTAGAAARFVFEEVPHPARIAKLIMKTHQEALVEEDRRRAQMHAEAGAATQPPSGPPQ